jgi:hypothetical protein
VHSKNFFSLVPADIKWRHFVSFLLHGQTESYLKTTATRGVKLGNLTAFRLIVKEETDLGYLDIDGEVYRGNEI